MLSLTKKKLFYFIRKKENQIDEIETINAKSIEIKTPKNIQIKQGENESF